MSPGDDFPLTSITDETDFLDEKKRHAESGEPGDAMRLSQREANLLGYDHDSRRGSDRISIPTRFTTGDKYHGIEVEIKGKGTAWTRWGPKIPRTETERLFIEHVDLGHLA